MSATDPTKPDLTEPKRLVRELNEMGMPSSTSRWAIHISGRT